MRIDRGIEIGHVFQLGKKYAAALDLKVLDHNGKQQVVTMGSYGIGVSRAVAVVAETCHDELGLRWPREIAPADVHVVVTGKPNDDISAYGDKLSHDLESRGIKVLIDDRVGVSPGVKFKDAELLGMPTIVVVGKSLADGKVEVRDRASGDRNDVAVDAAVDFIVKACRR
jgi:prolyl-tRNA synthetase